MQDRPLRAHYGVQRFRTSPHCRIDHADIVCFYHLDNIRNNIVARNLVVVLVIEHHHHTILVPHELDDGGHSGEAPVDAKYTRRASDVIILLVKVCINNSPVNIFRLEHETGGRWSTTEVLDLQPILGPLLFPPLYDVLNRYPSVRVPGATFACFFKRSIPLMFLYVLGPRSRPGTVCTHRICPTVCAGSRAPVPRPTSLERCRISCGRLTP